MNTGVGIKRKTEPPEQFSIKIQGGFTHISTTGALPASNNEAGQRKHEFKCTKFSMRQLICTSILLHFKSR